MFHIKVLCTAHSLNVSPLFSYGQTGTGKTFTMEGERSKEGSASWEQVRQHTRAIGGGGGGYF